MATNSNESWPNRKTPLESTNDNNDDVEGQTKPGLNADNVHDVDKEQKTLPGSSDDELPQNNQEPSTDHVGKEANQEDIEPSVANESNDNQGLDEAKRSPVQDDNKAIDVDQNQHPEGQEQPPTYSTGNDGNIDQTDKTDILDIKPKEEETETNLHPEKSDIFHNPTFPDDNIGEDAVHQTLIKSPSKMSIHGGITIAWDNIVAKVRSQRPSLIQRLTNTNTSEMKYKTILQGISGIVEPGNLVAIMGASGAGKTSMLNVLARRNCHSLRIQGQVTVNGRSVGKKITKLSAYFQQNDLFLGCMTVKEHLIFQALLRMKREIPYEDRLQRVDEVIEQFGLSKCANTVIGIPGTQRGISGGERRRLMFASELIIDAKLLFADEPTSGLDSYMAANVISALQQLAQEGKTILCTIHQPSSDVYAMFDRVLLMAEGRIAYMGKRDDAITFFKNVGYECPSQYNPADYFISILAINPSEEESSRKRIQEITEMHNKDRLEDIDDNDAIEWTEPQETPSKYNATWLEQMYALLWRSFIILLRNPIMTKVRMGQAIFTSLLVGLIYLQVNYNQDAVQNIGGAIFFVIINASFGNIFSVLRTFTEEVPVFIREHRNRMYRIDTFFLSKNIVEIPNAILASLLTSVITYWMIGLNPRWVNFLIYFGMITLVSNIAISYGYLISCAAKSIVIAQAISSLFILPLMLFGGFFVRSGTEKVYFVWLRYLSWFGYSFEALSINQWQSYGNLTCDPNIPTCFENGIDVLNFYNYKPENIYFDIGMLIMFLFAWRILAFIILYIRIKRTHEE